MRGSEVKARVRLPSAYKYIDTSVPLVSQLYAKRSIIETYQLIGRGALERLEGRDMH